MRNSALCRLSPDRPSTIGEPTSGRPWKGMRAESRPLSAGRGQLRPALRPPPRGLGAPCQPFILRVHPLRPGDHGRAGSGCCRTLSPEQPRELEHGLGRKQESTVGRALAMAHAQKRPPGRPPQVPTGRSTLSRTTSSIRRPGRRPQRGAP